MVGIAHRLSLFLLLFICTAGPLVAQSVRINVGGGYAFKHRFPIYTTLGALDASLEGAGHGMAGVEYLASPDYGVELYYVGMPTEGTVRLAGPRYRERVMVHYAMVGGQRYATLTDALSAYFGLGLGAGVFDGATVDRTYLAWGLRGGVMVKLTDALGLKLGAQVHSPIQGVGGGVYIGTGGVGGGVDTYSTIYQFALNAGLSWTIGSDKARGTAAPAR